MTILDLKKGDKVFGGKFYAKAMTGNAEFTRFEVRRVDVAMWVYLSGNYAESPKTTIWLRPVNSNRDMILAESLIGGVIFASENDYMDAEAIKYPTKKEIKSYLYSKFGLDYKVNDDAFCMWKWNAEDKKAEMEYSESNTKFNILADNPCPEGYYPTIEACEQANKKMVTIEVTRTYMTQREEGEDAEYLLNNPDEYEFQDGDECISDAQYAD